MSPSLRSTLHTTANCRMNSGSSNNPRILKGFSSPPNILRPPSSPNYRSRCEVPCAVGHFLTSQYQALTNGAPLAPPKLMNTTTSIKLELVPHPTVARQLFELYLSTGHELNRGHQANDVLEAIAPRAERPDNVRLSMTSVMHIASRSSKGNL